MADADPYEYTGGTTVIISDYGSFLQALAAFLDNHDNIESYERTETGFSVTTDDGDNFAVEVLQEKRDDQRAHNIYDKEV